MPRSPIEGEAVTQRNSSTRQRRARTATLPEERRLRIQDLLKSRQMIRAEELADELAVSLETVRRDLLALEERGAIRRVFGGVAPVGTSVGEPSFGDRLVQHADAKEMMARAAAQLVEPGATLALDVGTSVAAIAKHLPASFHGRVITTSMLVARELADRADIELVFVGGQVRGGDLACYGTETVEVLQKYYYSASFLGSGGVDPVAGLTDHYREEAAARRVLIANSDARYVMSDSSKLGTVAPIWVCDLAKIHAVITDAAVDEATLDLFEESGVRIIVASTSSLSTSPAATEPTRRAATRLD